MNTTTIRLLASTAICALTTMGISGCADPPPFGEGDCLHLSSTEPLQPVSCADPAADRRITRIVSGSSGIHLCDDIPRAIPYSYSSSNYGYYAMCLIPRAPVVSR